MRSNYRNIPGCPMSDNPGPGIKCGAGKLRFGILLRLGSPVGKGISPKTVERKWKISLG